MNQYPGWLFYAVRATAQQGLLDQEKKERLIISVVEKLANVPTFASKERRIFGLAVETMERISSPEKK